MKKTFVFGSNLAGRHGKGAALAASLHWGAIRGQGRGLQGNSYAIPTKDQKLTPLRLDIIERHAQEFLGFAGDHPDMEFHLTPIGCGLAGYTHAQIAPMFHKSPPNVILPDEFVRELKEEDE